MESKFKEDLKTVLDGGVLNYGKLFSPQEIEQMILAEGYLQSDYDSNGWQLDFWHYYKHESLPPITYSGCWFTAENNIYLTEN